MKNIFLICPEEMLKIGKVIRVKNLENKKGGIRCL